MKNASIFRSCSHFRTTNVSLFHFSKLRKHTINRTLRAARLRPPTRVVVNQVLQALEGEAGGDVVPAVVQSVDSVVLHTPVLHRQRVRACAHEADFIFPASPLSTDAFVYLLVAQLC